MQKNVKTALACWIRYTICAILAFFIYLSVSVITVGSFTDVIGYEARDSKTGETLYVYHYEDGEDTKAQEYKDKGIEIATLAIRNELAGTPKFFTVFISQLLALLMVVAFTHKRLWALGDSDANLVNFEHIKANKLRGLYIGLLAIIPNVISWLVVVASKLGIITDKVIYVFRLINYQLFSFINLLFGETTISTGDITWGAIILCLLIFTVLPIICFASYLLGFNRIRISEKLIYRKNDRG